MRGTRNFLLQLVPALGLALVCALCAEAAVFTNFYADFTVPETYRELVGVEDLNAGTRVGSWRINRLPGNGSIDSNNGVNHRLLLDGQGQGYDVDALFAQGAPLAGGVTVSFDFRLRRQGSARKNVILLRNEHGTNLARLRFWRDSGADGLTYLELLDGDEWHVILEGELTEHGTWPTDNELQNLRFECSADGFDVYFQDQLIVVDQAYINPGTLLDHVRFRSADIETGDSGTWLDHVLVTLPPQVFVNRTVELGLTLNPESVQGNAAWFDFNNNGWVDLVAGGRLWLNQQGEGFVRGPGGTIGRVVAADFNNNGWTDLFSWSQLRLYRNEQGNALVEVPLPAFPEGYVAGSAAWGDFTGNGFVDLYVSGYEQWETSTTFQDLLLINGGRESFTGVWINTGYRGRGVTACDFDQDSDLDVYVSNYRLQPNVLGRNDGTGLLANVAAAYNVSGARPGYSGGHSIGAVWGDFNNNGLFDLFAGNFSHGGQPESTFFRNRGPAHAYHFDYMGPCGIFWQESYASPAAGDFDNDGLLDLFFTTVYDVGSGWIRNYPALFRNEGGFQFVDATSLGLSGLNPTYQAAWADFNNNGRLDLLTAGGLFVNEGPAGNWLKVRLQGDGVAVDRSAIGAQVRIRIGDQILTRQVEAGTGQGNQNDLTLHFGLGEHEGPVDLEIRWRDGTETLRAGIQPNRTVEVAYRGVFTTRARPETVVLLDVAAVGDKQGIIRVSDSGHHAMDRLALGQTFMLETNGVVSHVTVLAGSDFVFGTDQHDVQLAFLKDTTGSGVGDTLVGTVFVYDFSGLVGTAGDYLQFELADLVLLLANTTYSFEIWYANAHPLHTQRNGNPDAANLQLACGMADSAHGLGSMLRGDGAGIGADFPFGEALTATGQSLNVMLQGIRRPSPQVDVSLDSGGGISFHWTGVADAVYTLQGRTSLVSGAWSNMYSGIKGFDGDLSAHMTNNAPIGFYRLVVE